MNLAKKLKVVKTDMLARRISPPDFVASATENIDPYYTTISHRPFLLPPEDENERNRKIQTSARLHTPFPAVATAVDPTKGP